MSDSAIIPTWAELFGALDFSEADPGRSVYSPAAYLADLLQVLEEQLDSTKDFNSRRPDISQDLILNGEQAFTLVPQLDIVNRVLAARIGADADRVLATARSPLSLPFEKEHERVRQALALLRTTPRDLYAHFARAIDVDVVARERLGLSPARVQAVLEDLSKDPTRLREAYGLKPGADLHSLLSLDAFRRATQVDGPTLRTLLFGRLSQFALDGAGKPEREAAGQLFIHHGLAGYVKLDDAEHNLLWSVAGQPIPDAWFDRVQRLLRLSRWTGVDLLSLDLVLRQLCNNTLDAGALRYLAVVVDLQKRTGADIDVLCGLIGDLDRAAALGASDDPQVPASLFDRVFNGAAARLAKRYVPSGSAYLPGPYLPPRPGQPGWDKLEAVGDLLSDDGRNKELRGRIQRALGLSAGDLTAVIKRFRDLAQARRRTSVMAGGLGPHGLAALYRVGHLADLLDLPPLDVLRLVDILEQDASLKRINSFEVLYHADVAHTDLTDLYRVLEQGPIAARSWLVQNLVAVAAWAGGAGLAPADLAAVALPPAQTAAARDAALAQLSQSLLDAFLPNALGADALVSGGLSVRMARIALGIVREPARSLVAKTDPRIVTFDAAAARTAAFDTLAALDVVTVQDIESLGLGDALSSYLQAVLVRRGLIDGQGLLHEAALPARPEDLELEPDFSDRIGPVFDLLHGHYQDAIDQGSAPEDVHLSLYPSDLLPLGFDSGEADEFVARLTFLGTLDAKGDIVDSSFFADAGNREALHSSVGLDDFRAEIHAALAAQEASWLGTPLTLPGDIWAALPISDGDRHALEQNLSFNGHIDAKRRIVDRRALLALTADRLDLALPFYRYRKQILAALQDFAATARAGLLTIAPDQLRPVADHMVAVTAHAALADTQLDADGRPSAGLRALLGSAQPAIRLDANLSATQLAQIWTLLRQIVADAGPYKLTDAALASIDITDEHVGQVLDALVAAEVLRADRTLVPDQVAVFTKINSALGFHVPGYDDYSKDVFFLLHDMAVATDAGVAALAAALAAVANAQGQAVLAALAAAIQLNADTTQAILRPILQGADPLVVLMGPVLATAGKQGTLDMPPRDRIFRAALRRTAQFAGYAAQLHMTAREIEAVFADQELVDKFPEAITLPDGVQQIDALWTGPNAKIYLFRGKQYWTFDANSLEAVDVARPLGTLSPEFADIAEVDAVYTTPGGDHWLLAAGRAYRRTAGSQRWARADRVFGRVQSRFQDPERIDGALYDDEGRLCLFAGDQYVRYSSWPQDFVDEGYPRRVSPAWSEEVDIGPLPAAFAAGLDAAVGRKDETTWLFKNNRFISLANPGEDLPIVESWGQVRHNLAEASGIDAVLDVDGACTVVVGDQATGFSGSLEGDDVKADEGSPRTLAATFPGLPEAFTHGFDAGLAEENGRLHLFREQSCATREKGENGDGGKWTVSPTGERFGKVRNNLQQTGVVDAALCGLDGRIYLFSGDQYVRYSGADFSRVDEGYPRTIAKDWAGLTRVDAAFALDGLTYLFGRNADGGSFYVRYSARDYTTHDADYPRPTNDNFWNLPQALLDFGFAAPRAVFVGPDGRTHLFSARHVISFDHNHRWWSEPALIKDVWSSLPFDSVSAAFTARDGRSYLFSDSEEALFVRYSDSSFERVDARFPKPVRDHWGKVVNNLARTGHVDAAAAMLSTVVTTDAKGVRTENKVRYRYLFSGDQFYRYSSDDFTFVDEGYPLRIQGALRREPHFVHLDPAAPVDRGIDGVWADTGNVFVFVGDQVYVASTAGVRQPGGLGVARPRAASIEQGRLTVYAEGGWKQVRLPEAHVQKATPAAPRALRPAPAAFHGALAAILPALDGNTYLFSTDRCWDPSLEHDYPTGAAWGRARNPIAEDERVDSALYGRDGKVYLFRGDLFVSYTPAAATPKLIPDLADVNPAPIADRFGGLRNVRHAFVHGGVTYLLEAPADDGTFRYVRYSGTDYGKPDDAAPQGGDFSFWNLPDDYVQQGFDRVDAVLGEGGDLILIRDRLFVHYQASTKEWTYARPLTLRWPDLPLRYPTFEAIRALMRGPDGATYFFSDGTWISHDGTRPGEIKGIAARWARLDNRITLTNRIDATFVYEDHTFLFSGDQYVRYTGSTYQYVDAGYPRPILGNLRREAPFQLLPEHLEDSFAALGPEDVFIETAFANAGVAFVQAAGRNFALSPRLSRTYPLGNFAAIRNELLRRARVDAAFRRDDGALFLLSGDQYVRYSHVDLDVVDDGYPRAIGGSDGLLREAVASPPALPDGFDYDLDAAFLAHGALYLFKGKSFVRYPWGQHGIRLSPEPVASVFGRVSNPFLPSEGNPAPRIDAAFVAPDGALYVMKGAHHLRYANPDADPRTAVADEGFPRTLRGNFGDLPASFVTGVDGGFVFDGRTYLCRKDDYVRYGDPTYTRMDPIYPQPFRSRWGQSNDFLLRDLRIIQQYIALTHAHPSDNASLTDFLLPTPSEQADPYALLATLFNWDLGDLEWLKRRAAFLGTPGREAAEEVRFDIEQALRIYDTMELARRMGSHPQELYEQVWLPLYGDEKTRNPSAAADTLRRLLGTLYPGADFAKIDRQLRDALNVALRDAQVAWLVAHDPADLQDVRDLSDLLLTDVEMDSCADTSAVVEAISAVQLYFHRYLMNLEQRDQPGDDEKKRADFKLRWGWLKNYRVWEANRKVFLYPESYLRPELRGDRTPAFKTLQDDLQQGEITDASVTQAYRKYLDEYTQVSRLTIAGGYVQPGSKDAADRELTLFGCTRTDPSLYYYRTATFLQGDSGSARWLAWKPLGVQINAYNFCVYPVQAFGRIFVFWAEVKQQNPDGSATKLHTTGDDKDKTVTSTTPVQYLVTVRYTFHDLNEQWFAPQTLKEFTANGAVSDVRLRVARSLGSGADAVEQVIVSCHYRVQTFQIDPKNLAIVVNPEVHAAAGLTADLVVADRADLPAADGRTSMFQGLFAYAEHIGLAGDSTITTELGSSVEFAEAPWYSFDLKGGSFLAKPSISSLGAEDRMLRPLAGNAMGLPSWDHVDACLDAQDGNAYLFNNQLGRYAVLGSTAESSIQDRWGLRRTAILADGKIDAAWWRGGVLFLLRGTEYIKYSDGTQRADRDGPFTIDKPAEGDTFPGWPAIDAAFTDATGRTWFFGTRDGKQESGHVDAHNQWTAATQNWGFADGKAIRTALVRGEHTFLVSEDHYVRYTGSEYAKVDAGYPKPLAGNPDGLPHAPFDAAADNVDGRSCFFMGESHVFGDALQAPLPNRPRFGRLRSNILTRGVEAAYRDGNRHYLVSGDEILCYTAAADNQLPLYATDPPIRLQTRFAGPVRGAFRYQDAFYVVGAGSFVRCDATTPERPQSGYPRSGGLDALLADLREHLKLKADPFSGALAPYRVSGLQLFGSRLYLGLSLQAALPVAVVIDLASGAARAVVPFTFMMTPDPVDWGILGGASDPFVDLPQGRYTFRGDRYQKTDSGVAATWTPAQNGSAVAPVWGGRPFGAVIALPPPPQAPAAVYLFSGDHYIRLSSGSVIPALTQGLDATTPIRGSFGNLPPEFQDGIDAALQHDGKLYLFKGARFAVLASATPYEIATVKYDLVRITSSTAAALNGALFAGGVDRLLSLHTQEIEETPIFSSLPADANSPYTIVVNDARVNLDTLPAAGGLDFGSANGIYYWEIFCHAPLLIAETLNTYQRFDEARLWYQRVFDPTEPAETWKFLPFLSIDTARIVSHVDGLLARGGWADPGFGPHRTALSEMAAAFEGVRDLDDAQAAQLKGMRDLSGLEAKVRGLDLSDNPKFPGRPALRDDLLEMVEAMEQLYGRWQRLYASRRPQIEAYLDDPFDPHAIAALRPIAYRKAVVMAYVGNLLDWGDMLFSQYTRESINEARMLYVEAWDVLGRRPESLGRLALPPECAFKDLRDESAPGYDLLLLEDPQGGTRKPNPGDQHLSIAGVTVPTPHDSVARSYFFVPPNADLGAYWIRVADRLYKIRHCLNLQGEKQPLSLFAPPLDPMALVRARAGGAGLSAAAEAGTMDVPHYRFSFLIGKAQGLAEKVSQLGSELLSVLERRDGEELSRMQARQEGDILAATLELHDIELDEANRNLDSLTQALANAQKRSDVYGGWLKADYLSQETTQMNLLESAAAFQYLAAVLHAVSGILAFFPEAMIGPFVLGIKEPNLSAGTSALAEVSNTLASGLQTTAEIIGITAQHQRSRNDWQLQKDLADIDVLQIQAQIAGANKQIEAAKKQIAITLKQIGQNQAVSDFYLGKFTSKELYEWMAARMSGIYYQSYQLALSLARDAERAFQFERGRSEKDTSFIQGQYWDSQKKGLSAGAALALDLGRMEAAFLASDRRRFEITKTMSLIHLDPMAFLKLKTEGACEFDFGEALFDYDFPGHYCRQVTTIAINPDFGQGVYVNATLTQLTSRVVMEPDPKAVAFLLDPKEDAPASIRQDWKAMQQVALSRPDDGEKNNGLYWLRFDFERYLPFEGTGAVSRWRLELSGRPGSYDLRSLNDVSIELKYTALPGGEAFAAAVRGLLKPVDTLRCFDLTYDFAAQWKAFLEGPDEVFEMQLHPAQFPNMASGRIRAIYARYQTDAAGAPSFVLDLGQQLELPDGKTVDTSGLTVRAAGTTLRLKLNGDKSMLKNVYLLMSYKAGV